MTENTTTSDLNEYSVDIKAYEELEQNYQAVLQELIGDKSLESFKDQYDQLHRALKRSADNNKRLISKCQELNDEITNNSSKVEKSLELLQQDRRTISSLRQEIDKAWKMVETAQGREKKAGETIEALKAEISHFTALVQQGGLLSYGHDNTVKDLVKTKEDLIIQREAQVRRTEELDKQLVVLTETLEKAEKEKSEMEQVIAKKRTEVASKKSLVDHETVRRDRLVKQHQNLRVTHQRLLNQIEAQNKEISIISLEEDRVNQDVEVVKSQIEKVKEDNKNAQNQEEELEKEIKRETERAKSLKESKKTLETTLAEKEKEIRDLKNDIDRKSRENQSLQQNITMSKLMLTQDEAELATLKTEVESMEKEISDLNKHLERNQIERKNIQGKLDQISKSKHATAALIDKQKKISSEETENREELEAKLISYQDEANKMKQLITNLEKKRENCAREAADAQAKLTKAKEEAKMSEIQLNHTQRLITAADEDLKQKQHIYEQLRVERNNYNRQLMNSQELNVQLREKLQSLTKEATLLKNEIKEKKNTYASEHFELKKEKTKKDKLVSEMERLQAAWDESEATMLRHQEEIRMLETRIQEADEERKAMLKKQIEAMKERDILGTQLIRRNDEIALQYEKLKILSETLRSGEAQYAKRCEDANELKRLIKDTQRKNLILQRQCDQTSSLEAKVKTLQKDLIQEQTRVKALSEELEDPNNPHRWRHLYGEDPSPPDLLKNIKKLQMRLIKKTESIVNTKKAIEEIKKEIAEVQEKINKQPTPEMIQEMKSLQLKIKQKDRQLKAMAAEINTQNAKLDEFSMKQEELGQKLIDARNSHFAQKKAFASIQSRRNKSQLASLPPSMSGSTAFTPSNLGSNRDQ